MTATALLEKGSRLDERFELIDVLCSGEFTTSYLALDTLRGDRCVVKELAPVGAPREGGVVHLDHLGIVGQHLRQRFLEEARKLARIHLPCVLPIRSTFSERGTAYYVTDYLDDAHNLDDLLAAGAALPLTRALPILFELREALDELHERGVVHKNLKPANLILTAAGKLVLTDFAAAREWYADATENHETLFDSPYVAPEQLSAHLNRGPATDVFAYGQVAYHLLTGHHAPHATELLKGSSPRPASALRPDVDEVLSNAIDQCLKPRYLDRPQTIDDLRELMNCSDEDDEDGLERLRRLDETAAKLKKFHFEIRQCPACGDVLEAPHLLRKGVCPVCHDGQIKMRIISENFCPVCGGGVLRQKSREGLCPLCHTAWLEFRREKLFARKKIAECRNCDAKFEVEGFIATLLRPEPPDGEPPMQKTWAEWNSDSPRPDQILTCDSCHAQFDRSEDGRMRQMWPEPEKYKALYPDEWARVAAGLLPHQGNAECGSCRADYCIDGGTITLLKGYRDPFGFAARYEGKLLRIEDLPFLGSGKESRKPGLVCVCCPTELDFYEESEAQEEQFYLVRTDNRTLRPLIGQVRTMEDWHRISRHLPVRDYEAQWQREFDQAVIRAFELGDLWFDEDVLWRGPARRLEERNDELEEGGSGTVLITTEEIAFGGLIRKWRRPLSDIESVEADEDTITFHFRDEPAPILFDISPVELTATLEHTSRSVLLNAVNLAIRLGCA
jgi:serine/threonine protein kinase